MFFVVVMLLWFKTYSTSHVLCRDVFVFQDIQHFPCFLSLWCFCVYRLTLTIIRQFCVLCRCDVLFAFEDSLSSYTNIRQFCVVVMSLHFKTKSVALHWRSPEVVCSVSVWCLVCISRQSLSPYTDHHQTVCVMTRPASPHVLDACFEQCVYSTVFHLRHTLRHPPIPGISTTSYTPVWRESTVLSSNDIWIKCFCN